MNSRSTDTRYHYLVVSAEQKAVLKAEAEARGAESMAALVKEALDGDGEGLCLPNPGGSLHVSLGIRSTDEEIARYKNKAVKSGMHREAWERSRLFTPGCLTLKERRAMAREAQAD